MNIQNIIGKCLEFAGLVFAGLALATGMYANSMRGEMMLLGLAIVIFFSGWWIGNRES